MRRQPAGEGGVLPDRGRSCRRRGPLRLRPPAVGRGGPPRGRHVRRPPPPPPPRGVLRLRRLLRGARPRRRPRQSGDDAPAVRRVEGRVAGPRSPPPPEPPPLRRA